VVRRHHPPADAPLTQHPDERQADTQGPVVKAGEQVVFTIRAFTSKCYCEWELLVTAIVDGKEQVFRVRNGDRPFRTTAFATRYDTVYSFNFFTGRFVKLPPETKFPPPEFGP
jgi:hypothetical protein